MWQQPLHRRSPPTTVTNHRTFSSPGNIPEEEELNPNNNHSLLYHSHHTSLTSLHSLTDFGQVPHHLHNIRGSSFQRSHGGLGGLSQHNSSSYQSLFSLPNNGTAGNSTGTHTPSQVYAALGLRRPRRSQHQQQQQQHESGSFHRSLNTATATTAAMGRSQSMSSVYYSRHRHHQSRRNGVKGGGGGGNETFRLGGSYFASHVGNGVAQHSHSNQVTASNDDNANTVLRRLSHLMNEHASKNAGMGSIGNTNNNGHPTIDIISTSDSAAAVATTSARMHHMNNMKMENATNSSYTFPTASSANNASNTRLMSRNESLSFGSNNNSNIGRISDDNSSSFHPPTSTHFHLNNGTGFPSNNISTNMMSRHNSNTSLKLGSTSSSPILECSYVPLRHCPHYPFESDGNKSYSNSSDGNITNSIDSKNSLLSPGNNHNHNLQLRYNPNQYQNHAHDHSNTTNNTSNNHPNINTINTFHNTTKSNNNNNNNNNNINSNITGPSKLYRLISAPPDDSTTPLTPRQWSTILQRARTHPREACFFDPNLGGHVYALHRLLRRSGEEEGCHPPYEVVEAVIMACPRAVTRKQRVIDEDEFLEEEESENEENGDDVENVELSGGQYVYNLLEDGNSGGRDGVRGGNDIGVNVVMGQDQQQEQLNHQQINPNANVIDYLQRIHEFHLRQQPQPPQQYIEQQQQQQHQPMEDDVDEDNNSDDNSRHLRIQRHQQPLPNNNNHEHNDDDEEDNSAPDQENNYHDDVRFEYPLAIACECNQSNRIIRLLASSVLQNSSNPVYRSEVFRSLDYASLPNRIVRILLEEYAGCVLERGTDSEASEGDDDDCPLEKVLFWWDDPDMLDMEMDIENYPNCHMKDDLCDLFEKIRMMLYAAIRGTMGGYDEWKEEFPVLHHALRIVVNGGIRGVRFPNDFAHAVYLLAKFIWKEKGWMFRERDERGMLPIHIVVSGRGFFPLTDVIRVDDQNDGGDGHRGRGGAGVMDGDELGERVIDYEGIGDNSNAIVRAPSQVDNEVEEPNAQDAAAAPREQQRGHEARNPAVAQNNQEAVDGDEIDDNDEDNGNPGESSLENYPSPRQSGLEVVKLLLQQYPESINIPDPQTGSLPIHLILLHNPLATEVIDYFLDLHPDSVTKPDGSGRLPIHIALLQKSPSWEEVIKLSPTLLESRDPVTGLLPFQLAAMAESRLDETNTISTVTTTAATTTATESEVDAGTDTAQQDLDSLTTIFRLLRMSPCLASGLADVKSPPQSLIEQKIMARYKPRVVKLEEENARLRRKVAELERKLMEFHNIESDSSTEQPAATKKRKSSTSSILSMSNFRL